MAKSLFLFVISGLIGVVMHPGILSAADAVRVTSVNDSRAVETVLPLEPEPVVAAPVVAKAPAAGYVAPANNVSIAGRVIGVVNVGSTAIDAGNHVNKYGERFLYGHNTAAVFGGVLGMGAGSTFTMTYGGVTTTYQVARAVMFEKNGEILQLNGAGDFMNATARAVHLGVQYDMAVMTCAGTSYGNGDASHRYVLFANAM